MSDAVPTPKIVDLRDVLSDPAVASMVVGLQAPAAALLADHQRHDRTRVALGAMEGETLTAVIIARTPHWAICEVLASGGDFATHGAALIEAAAEWFNALAIWASIGVDDVDRWSALGFTCRPDPSGPQWYRAERRRPAEPDGHHTAPKIAATGDRRFDVVLPPEGNTLPVLPRSLRDVEVPAFVLSWILETDEIFLLVQDIVPELFPPVTPAKRPASIRDALGSLGDAFGDRRLDSLASDDNIPDLPGGVRVPVRLLEIAAAMARVQAWLAAARRVQTWASAHSAEAEEWVEHAVWHVHDDMTPELLRPPRE